MNRLEFFDASDPDWIKVDYFDGIRPNPETYVFPELAAVLEQHRRSIMRFYTTLCPWMDSRALKSVTDEQVDDKNPYWENGYFNGGDARSAYAITAYFKPGIILEIGSGHSTRFFRKAITDHNTRTRLICIDPAPRAAVTSICDEHLQQSATRIEPSYFDQLRPGDILFIDGSHIVFNGSDTVHLFLTILPRLAPGVLVHVHDVMLPYEYIDLFTLRHYNEQYLLGGLLLNKKRWRPILPFYWMDRQNLLLSPFHKGVSFWMISMDENSS